MALPLVAVLLMEEGQRSVGDLQAGEQSVAELRTGELALLGEHSP